MVSNPRMKFNAYAVFCDEIRQEITGKFFLIGAYGGDMQVNAGPVTVNISTWVQISGLSKGKHTLKFIARKHVGKQSSEMGTVQVEFDVSETDKPMALPLPALPLQVDADCVVKLTAYSGNDSVVAGELHVMATFANTET